MPKSIKLTDSTYWDATGIVVKANGSTNYKTLDTAMYEMQAGRTVLGSFTGNNRYAYFDITFPRAFTSAPLVIISNSTDTKN